MMEQQPSNKEQNKYAEFNKVQTLFYTDVVGFNELTNFELKRNAFMLISNVGKGFPALANVIINIYSPHVKAIESPEILRALQHRFINPYSPRKGSLPKFIYFKNLDVIKDSKVKKIPTKKRTENGDEFSKEIVSEICSILMYDSKTYDTLKYTEKVQFLGNQLLGEFMKKEKAPTKRKPKI